MQVNPSNFKTLMGALTRLNNAVIIRMRSLY